MWRRAARGAVVCVCVWRVASGRWWTFGTWTRTMLGARWGWRGRSRGTASDGCGCRGPEVVSLAGLRALRGVWLFGGLPRPSVSVRGSGVDGDGGLVQPLVVRVTSSVDVVSVWAVRAVLVGADGRERDGEDVVECEGLGGSGGVVRISGLDGGARYVVRGCVWSGGRESVSLWSCGVTVVTSSEGWLPRAMRLPAVNVGVDVGALVVGRACGDRHGWVAAAAECGCAGR